MKRLYFKERDILQIAKTTKTKTCRPYEQKDKFKIGDFVECYACHSAPKFADVKIMGIELIEDIETMPSNFFKDLGYKSKREYLAEDFNINAKDNRRICITFSWCVLSISAYCEKFRLDKEKARKEAEKEALKKWAES